MLYEDIKIICCSTTFLYNNTKYASTNIFVLNFQALQGQYIP